MPISVAGENASCTEAAHPPPATKSITSYTADDPAPEALSLPVPRHTDLLLVFASG